MLLKNWLQIMTEKDRITWDGQLLHLIYVVYPNSISIALCAIHHVIHCQHCVELDLYLTFHLFLLYHYANSWAIRAGKKTPWIGFWKRYNSSDSRKATVHLCAGTIIVISIRIVNFIFTYVYLLIIVLL
jgi:hypothetical protein